MLVKRLSQQLQNLLQLHIARHAASTTKKPPISQKVRFIDQLRVTVRGGHGGGGSSALFGRTGHHPRAAGGNGAPGGAVVLRATKHLTGLGTIPLHVDGERGGKGGKQWMDGKKGSDKIVPVPLGTLVYQLVELRGQEGRSRPHGVTALPHRPAAAAAGPAVVSSGNAAVGADCQQRPARLVTDGVEVHGTAEPAQQQEQLHRLQQQESLQQHTASSNRLPHRRLFTEEQLRAAAHPGDDLAAQAQQHWQHDTSTTAAASQGSSVDAGGGETAASADMDATDRLYQQLITCERILTNSDKLHLLSMGRLPDLDEHSSDAVGLDSTGSSGWQNQKALGSDCSSSSSSERLAESIQEVDSNQHFEEDWSHDYETDGEDVSDSGMGQDIWVGADVGEVQLQRQFTKEQVWSILESQAVLLGELDQDGQELVVATGGSGGRGNAVVGSRPNRPASRMRSDGAPGQEVLLLMKLRLLADVVLVGLPNVGKSSLIAALTDARAQIGSYAFTTLRPQLGTIVDNKPLSAVDRASQVSTASARSAGSTTVESTNSKASDLSPDAVLAAAAAAAGTSTNSAGDSSSSKLVIADLPGLVPGAHAGRGRGTAFLAHLAKARCLALVIDMTGTNSPKHQLRQQEEGGQPDVDNVAGGAEGPWSTLVPYTPQQQLSILQEELSKYDAQVLQMPMLVVANKLDALSSAAGAEALRQIKAATHLPIIPVSAKQKAGLQRLKNALQLLVSDR